MGWMQGLMLSLAIVGLVSAPAAGGCLLLFYINKSISRTCPGCRREIIARPGTIESRRDELCQLCCTGGFRKTRIGQHLN